MKQMTVEQCQLVIRLVKEISSGIRPGIRLVAAEQLGEHEWESKDSRIGGDW